MSVFHYRYFDRVLASSLPLKLAATSGMPAWCFSQRLSPDWRTDAPFAADAWQDPAGQAQTEIARCSTHYRVRFYRQYEFKISLDGKQIVCSPELGLNHPDIVHLLLAQVLPMAISLGGRRVFHAASVLIGGQAVVLLGASGAGKSTLTAALSKAGAQLAGDDGLILEPDGQGWRVIPSYPSLRLWGDSSDKLLSNVPGQPMCSHSSKRTFVTEDVLPVAKPGTALRLGKIYLLDNTPAQDVTLSPITPVKCFHALLDAQFRLEVPGKSLLEQEFRELGRLINTVPISLLSYPRDYTQLHRVCESVLNDMA